MVATTQVKPAFPLQPFISCYALREFNTGGNVMPQPLHAVQESYMTFFLKDQYCTRINADGKTRKHISNSVCNLFTGYQGYLQWQGDYEMLSVQFISNGIYAVLGIPQHLLTNSIPVIADLLGNDDTILTEQLASCSNIVQMSRYLDDYFINTMLHQRHSYYTHTIAHCSGIILHNNGMVSLSGLAYHANMSIRNFERRFVQEVGLPPKLYARITRFYKTIEDKMLHPHKSFTAIAHEGGYFYQAHFIKDCKEFASATPEELFKHTPPPTETFIAIVAY